MYLNMEINVIFFLLTIYVLNEPVLSGKRNIVGVEDKTDMLEDYNKFDEIPPFKVKTDPTILLNGADTPWLRPTRS